MDGIKTTAQLFELLKGASNEETVELDRKQLRYVIYARKSTMDDERQERSIPDQVSDCIKSTVTPEGLNVVDVIEEKYSAKEPDVRLKFRAMLDDIKSGRVDGVIA